MTFSLSDLVPLWLCLGLAGVAFLVFLLDLVFTHPRHKWILAAVTILGSVALMVCSAVWPPYGTAFAGTYVGDGWALYLQQLFLGICAVATLGSLSRLRRVTPHRYGEYLLLQLFSLLGMMILVGARDLVLLLLSFELMGLPLLAMAAIEKTDLPGELRTLPAEASTKFLVSAVVSTPMTLFGAALATGPLGSTSLAALSQAPWTPLLQAGVVLMVAGMGFKIGVVPFHMWVPDTYQAVSNPFAGFLSTAPKVAGMAALARILLFGLGQHTSHWAPTVMLLTGATLVLGNLWAVSQNDSKRLLAYSGIGHVGYLLLALLAGTYHSVAMMLFYLVAYAFTNLGTFLVLEAADDERGDTSLGALRGLARRSPWLALSMLLFLLSLAGIPFVLGFWAKLYVFIAAWAAGYGWFVLLGAILAVVALFYYMQVARSMYMNQPTDQRVIRVHPALTLAILACLAVVVGYGAYPTALVQPASVAASDLIGAPSQPLSFIAASPF